MTVDKNISLTYYKLDNWLNFKSNYLAGRIALVSVSLFSLAEAVSRITVGSL